MAATSMTDAQAIDILEKGDPDSYYPTQGNPRPVWGGGKNPHIQLDGFFTRDELLAILHFHPENKEHGNG
jgi:hypothetical protein